MKCRKCGSEWESKIKTINCPFCGAPIDSGNRTFNSVLNDLVKSEGSTILYSRRVVAFLKDLLPDENVRTRLLGIAIDNNVGKLIVEGMLNPDSTWETTSASAVKRLHEYAFLDVEKARAIVTDIGVALNYVPETNEVVDKEVVKTDSKVTTINACSSYADFNNPEPLAKEVHLQHDKPAYYEGQKIPIGKADGKTITWTVLDCNTNAILLCDMALTKMNHSSTQMLIKNGLQGIVQFSKDEKTRYLDRGILRLLKPSEVRSFSKKNSEIRAGIPFGSNRSSDLYGWWLEKEGGLTGKYPVVSKSGEVLENRYSDYDTMCVRPVLVLGEPRQHMAKSSNIKNQDVNDALSKIVFPDHEYKKYDVVPLGKNGSWLIFSMCSYKDKYYVFAGQLKSDWKYAKDKYVHYYKMFCVGQYQSHVVYSFEAPLHVILELLKGLDSPKDGDAHFLAPREILEEARERLAWELKLHLKKQNKD